MDVNQLLEYIVPIAFLIVWSIAKVLGSKDQPQEEVFPGEGQSPAPQANQDTYEELFGPVVMPTVQKPQEPELLSDEELLAIQRSQEEMEKVELLKSERQDLQSTAPHASVEGFSIVQESQKKAASRESIKDLLSTPNATRKAFLLYEVLGTPVGSRENGKIGKFWES